MQGVMYGDSHPKVDVYDGGDHFSDHLHQLDEPVLTLPLSEGGSC